MRSSRDRLIHLHRCRGISRRTLRKIIYHDPTLNNIYLLSSTQISQQYLLPSKNATLLFSDLHSETILQQIKRDIARYPVITIVDESYPPVLKTIKDPPLVLYTLGNRSLLTYTPAISVIGTRNPSTEAKRKVDLLVKPLLLMDWLIVSGMAKGIDSFSHIAALENMGKTIAVLGSGFHHIYPKQNTSLFKQIAEKGLVLSEYPPDTPAKRYHFPERNRIISGLSFGTLVIEATEKSGTLITVDQALDQGREVYAVPGSPLIPQTKGCHKMIQDGAKLVHNAEDILEDWESIGINLMQPIK
ncbi:DNA-protecting protein DprA [Virgibacillus profundi]|uniref:DNA-protecting protein DprA n=1 Tax=Virgibacillus profundi TaxID=2024555 RepID=A0A2A2IF56_9BACI|nr:DNA-processing protein DprA [Virgibacillus profundi]PAV29988.1 DNA-protecting protein DprA [Virgibacillus profundi]PXY54161.1 DNA-protecting protein DprA [Virgibacillus profundi]